jgi:hypothetical protein
MQEIVKYKTFDDKEHDTKELALKHLDKEYGNLLSSISHNIIKTDCKYVNIMNYINDNLHLFIELNNIKRDRVL